MHSVRPLLLFQEFCIVLYLTNDRATYSPAVILSPCFCRAMQLIVSFPVNRIVALLSLPHSWCLTDLQFTSVVLKKAHEFYPYTVKRSAFWDETCSHTSLFCLLSMRIRTELQNFQFTWWSSQKAGLVLSDAAGQKFCFHVLFHSTQNLLCSEAVH